MKKITIALVMICGMFTAISMCSCKKETKCQECYIFSQTGNNTFQKDMLCGTDKDIKAKKDKLIKESGRTYKGCN